MRALHVYSTGWLFGSVYIVSRRSVEEVEMLCMQLFSHNSVKDVDDLHEISSSLVALPTKIWAIFIQHVSTVLGGER